MYNKLSFIKDIDGTYIACGQCVITGRNYCVTKLKVEDLERYRNGALMQNAFPYLNSDDREFLITGLSPEAWDKFIKDE